MPTANIKVVSFLFYIFSSFLFEFSFEKTTDAARICKLKLRAFLLELIVLGPVLKAYRSCSYTRKVAAIICIKCWSYW